MVAGEAPVPSPHQVAHGLKHLDAAFPAVKHRAPRRAGDVETIHAVKQRHAKRQSVNPIRLVGSHD